MSPGSSLAISPGLLRGGSGRNEDQMTSVRGTGRAWSYWDVKVLSLNLDNRYPKVGIYLGVTFYKIGTILLPVLLNKIGTIFCSLSQQSYPQNLRRENEHPTTFNINLESNQVSL